MQVHMYATYKLQFRATLVHEVAAVVRAMGDLDGTVASADGRLGQAVLMHRCRFRLPAPRSSFAGFRFPPEVIMVAVRWYLRYGLSYRT